MDLSILYWIGRGAVLLAVDIGFIIYAILWWREKAERDDFALDVLSEINGLLVELGRRRGSAPDSRH